MSYITSVNANYFESFSEIVKFKIRYVPNVV